MPVEEIQGYNEFQRDTARIEKGFPEAMRQASISIATEWIAAAQTMAGLRQQARAAQSLIMATNTEGAQIRSDLEWFGGAEFGGQGRPQTMQFPPYMGQRGYFLWPAERQNDDRFMQTWDDGVQAAMIPWNRHG